MTDLQFDIFMYALGYLTMMPIPLYIILTTKNLDPALKKQLAILSLFFAPAPFVALACVLHRKGVITLGKK